MIIYKTNIDKVYAELTKIIKIRDHKSRVNRYNNIQYEVTPLHPGKHKTSTPC